VQSTEIFVEKSKNYTQGAAHLTPQGSTKSNIKMHGF